MSQHGNLDGNEDAEEVTAMDADRYQVSFAKDHIEFTTGNHTVRKEATDSFLGVPVMSDVEIRTIPGSVVRVVYAGAQSAGPGQKMNRKKFTNSDNTKGHPSVLICNPEDVSPHTQNGHANITGQANTDTQDQYQPGASANIHSVLTNGPHIALDGIARRREDGSERTEHEIQTETDSTLREAGFDVMNSTVSRDTFRPYCSVTIWLQGDSTVAQALILYLSDRSVPDLAIYTKEGTVMGCPEVRIPCYHPRKWHVMQREQSMKLESPRGETAREAMEWINGLFRREVVDWRGAEILEVSKNNANDTYCAVIFSDPNHIAPHVGAVWEGRILSEWTGTSSTWSNRAKNEIRIENLPHDIDEDQEDRQIESVEALTEALESQVGELAREILTRYWFDPNSRKPSLLCNLASDGVFESKMTMMAGRTTRVFRELTVRVEFEGKTHRIHVKPTKRSVEAVGEGISTGSAEQKWKREQAIGEARHSEESRRTNRQLAQLQQAISQSQWGPVPQTAGAQLDQQKAIDECYEKMALANKETTDKFLATLRQQWATAEEASKLNAESNVRQENAAAYLKLQNESTVVAINAHGNRTNSQLLAQNAHMERQDQQAFKQQEAFTANLASAVNAITGAIASGTSALTTGHATAAGASQQAATATTSMQFPYQQAPQSSQGGWTGTLTPKQVAQVMQNMVSPQTHEHTPYRSNLRTHDTRNERTRRNTPRTFTPTYLRHPLKQHEKFRILTHTNDRPTMLPNEPPSGAAAPAGAGVPRRAAGLLLEHRDGRASRHHCIRSGRTSRRTNIWVSLLVIFALLISYTHTTKCLRALTRSLTNTCTILERILTHTVTTQGGHTLPSDRDGVPVRWASRSGNLRTRGKRLVAPNRRTHRGRKKWANHPATTKPKHRLDTVRKQASAWSGTLQAQHGTRRMGPTYAEPVATAPDTTTEHTAPEGRRTHVTNPTQEQQEGHGPMPTNAAPADSD
jgi:hypothetical protein